MIMPWQMSKRTFHFTAPPFLINQPFSFTNRRLPELPDLPGVHHRPDLVHPPRLRRHRRPLRTRLSGGAEVLHIHIKAAAEDLKVISYIFSGKSCQVFMLFTWPYL